MGKSLAESFEARYQNGKESSVDTSKGKLWSIVEEELPLQEGLEIYSDRARLKVNSVYRLYCAICRLKGKRPDYLFNGRDLISVDKYQNLKDQDEVDETELEKLWKNLGD